MHSVLASVGVIRAGTTVPLDEEERHHLRVRRAKAGEPARIQDGAGTVG
ncbi:MAG: hypothetical protein HOP28_10330, partial [Gemmatimonadales bacterium]|nr:hypothetical protein [Gemmatimonadales bacterium]